jgi:hypothetical protein
MAEENQFIFMNLNTYSVTVTTERGVPLTVPLNKAVDGDFFVRFSAPNGPLSMVQRSKVTPEAIIYVAVPRNEHVEKQWEKDFDKADPMLATPPVSVAPALVAVEEPVVEEEPVEEPVEQENREVEAEAVPESVEAPEEEKKPAKRGRPKVKK